MTTDTPSNLPPTRVFLSYAHTDEQLLNELKKHLAALKRQKAISMWHDREITAGNEWAGKISQELEEADIILLLISPDFINSNYCYDVELERAMKRYEAHEALVIPIFLRPCDWQGLIFGKLQGLPHDARPITGSSWSTHDEAFEVVAKGIRKAITEWGQRGKGSIISTHSEAPLPTHSASTPAYAIPKKRSNNFNPFQAARETLTLVDQELTSRMKNFEAAGYVVDRESTGDRTSFRIISDNQIVYFIDMRLGGLGGRGNGLSFYHGLGNHRISDSSTTATATLVADEYTDKAKLDVLNMSLLGHTTGRNLYSVDEFVNTLWEQIVNCVDQRLKSNSF